MLKEEAIFRSIRKLHITAKHDVENLFSGMYRSVFKGKGLEFEDVREYQAGDDIRSIDWNVTARSLVPFVKNFREERELTVMLLVDISASSFFGHAKRLKSQMIAELAALIAFCAITNHDKIGLLLFSNEIELYLKPKNGLRHVLRVIRALLNFKSPHRGTNLQRALNFFGKIQKHRAICFLISDFLTPDFCSEVTLIAQKHELIAFHIFDSYEKCFEPKALLALRDLESQEELLVDTADIGVQRYFQEQAQTHHCEIQRLFERIGARYVEINTLESASLVLRRFFQCRTGKR